MPFAEKALISDRPAAIGSVSMPCRIDYHPSSGDWRDELRYFMLFDRFSDVQQECRPLQTGRGPPRQLALSRSGGERWQGGTLQGFNSKLDHLKNLGMKFAMSVTRSGTEYCDELLFVYFLETYLCDDDNFRSFLMFFIGAYEYRLHQIEPVQSRGA